MAKIISANYRDRQSEYRWLVRDENQQPKEAVACKAVVIPGRCRFEQSNKYEEGFGCRYVAKAEGDVQLVDIEPMKGKPLTFDGFHDFRDENGISIRETDSMTLNADGSIIASW